MSELPQPKILTDEDLERIAHIHFGVTKNGLLPGGVIRELIATIRHKEHQLVESKAIEQRTKKERDHLRDGINNVIREFNSRWNDLGDRPSAPPASALHLLMMLEDVLDQARNG
jgi:hypothetical protein